MKRSPGRGGEPPAIVRLILLVLLPAEEREFFLGDLQESGRRGWSREIASAAAYRFGRRSRRRDVARSRSPGLVAGVFAADLRLGLRRLSRAPGSTLLVLMALSLGIGLSALMFSLISSALLPTLPFDAGDRIVKVNRVEHAPITAARYAWWRERQRSFEGLGGWVERPVNLTIEGEGGEPVWSAAVEPAAFSLLSVRPVLGRGLTEADAAPGSAAVVLVSRDVWLTRLNGDPGVVGRVVRVNGEPAEIVGVMPEGFGFPVFHSLWTPLRLDALRPARNPEGLALFGVLAEGVAEDVAEAELNELDRQYPRAAGESDPAPIEVRAYTDIVNPRGRSGQLAGLMLVVALLVLAVACANATNVLLAQAAVRGREVALRSALGASRWRIATEHWSEVALLAVGGAAGGVWLATVGLRVVRAAVPPGLPFWFDLRIDLAALAWTAVSAMVAALVAGIAPSAFAARASADDLLKDASRGASSRRLGRVMSRLIATEMAASFVLLLAAGIFVRAAVNVETHRFGFEPEGVYTAHVRLPDGRYDGVEAAATLAQRLEAELAAVPGAGAVALTTALPGIAAPLRPVAVEGSHAPADPDLPDARYVAASSRFFDLFRAASLEGRLFDSRDRSGELPVAIVNRAFERRHLPAGALGHRIALPARDGEAVWLTIVGVVPDYLLPGGLENGPQEAIYRPLAQDPVSDFLIAVRSNGAGTGVAGPVREAVSSVDSDAALFFEITLDEYIAAANSGFRWVGMLFLLAGGMALFLAAVGLYGVMAFWVARRTREIGVRMALGGGRRATVALVLRQALVPVGSGVIIGTMLSVLMAWVLHGTLAELRPFDPLIFGIVAAVLLAAGTLGCVLPALRATRVDPHRALAAE